MLVDIRPKEVPPPRRAAVASVMVIARRLNIIQRASSVFFMKVFSNLRLQFHAGMQGDDACAEVIVLGQDKTSIIHHFFQGFLVWMHAD